MNKKLTFLIAFLAVISLSFISCSDSFENQFKVVNSSAADLELLFGSKIYNVPAGETLIINDVPAVSNFTYSCRFPGLTNYTASGALSGTISFVDDEEDYRTALKALLYLVSTTSGETLNIQVYLSIENQAGVIDPLVGP